MCAGDMHRESVPPPNRCAWLSGSVSHWDVERAHERRRLLLTPLEVDTIQEWLLRRHRQLTVPLGVRRRTDTQTPAKRTLKEWRVLRGLSLNDVLERIHKPFGRMSIEVLRALENGTATWNVKHHWLERLCVLYGVPEACVRAPLKRVADG